jgi:diguanylate cyclase (GGDEF)-like protein
MLIAMTYLSTTFRHGLTPIQEIDYLVDSNDQYTVSKIQKIADYAWQKNDQKSASSDIPDDLRWFRFTLAELNTAQSWLLEIEYPMLGQAKVWFVQQNKLLAEYQLGDTLLLTQRHVNQQSFVMPIPKVVGPIQVYINSSTAGVMRTSPNVWQQQDYLIFVTENSLVMGMFFGLMLTISLASLLFFITTREVNFLVYTGFVICLTLTLSALDGLGYRYIWPHSVWWQGHAVGVFANLTLFLSIIFYDQLLSVKTYNIKLSKLLNMTAYGFLALSIISLFIPLQFFINTFLFMFCVYAIVIFAVTIWLWNKGLNIARFYTFAWAVLFFSSLIVGLDNLDIIKVNLPSHYVISLGAAIETLILGIILASNHYQQQQTLIEDQAELLENERRSEDAHNNQLAIDTSTEELEYKVQERTLELEIALRELSDTNRELQEINTLDALTGIRNRSYFDKKYLAEVRRSRREQTQLSVVMLDIDHFKKVNDQYGHLVGDECIKNVARSLASALRRPSDDVCRYGGEEFALILPNTDLPGAMSLVDQLRLEIAKNTIQTEDKTVNITISAGIGTAIADLNQPEDCILALADKQLYAAKNAGRNNVKGSYLEGSHLAANNHQD